MENQPNPIGSLFESAGSYLETRIDLLKLKAVSKSSDIVSSIVSGLVILVLITFGILILSVGLAIWAGSLLGSLWYGFFAVGGFYVLLSILLIAFKGKWLKGPVSDIVVKKLLN